MFGCSNWREVPGMVAQVDPLDLKPGQMVDGWRIVRRIGSGGYAVVYEVEKDGQRFALKVACQTERSRDPRQVDARAMREVACLRLPRLSGQWDYAANSVGRTERSYCTGLK
jgi:hypothetical protein